MEKEILDNLFKLDKIYSRPGTEGEKGSALGLILCKDFIEQHGGIIKVESEPGKGSTFSFMLPKVSPNASENNNSESQIKQYQS